MFFAYFLVIFFILHAFIIYSLIINRKRKRTKSTYVEMVTKNYVLEPNNILFNSHVVSFFFV